MASKRLASIRLPGTGDDSETRLVIADLVYAGSEVVSRAW
jgi:hypothetical protein